MSYRNAIRDIQPGSLWADRDRNLLARVDSAAAGHVSYRHIFARPTIVPLIFPRGAVMTPERDFRVQFEPLYDRAAIRQQFTMSLANLGEFRVYWLPIERRILCRSVACSRQFRVPDGAIAVGVYSAPCAPGTLFEDLDEIITATEEAHGQEGHSRPNAAAGA